MSPQANVQIRSWLCVAACLACFCGIGLAQTRGQNSCRVKAVTFEGWPAEEMANGWVRLTVVPELGGRLMQVEFGGHAYLFVNPRYKGKYIPPSDPAAKSGWINYGGDKIWPLPEGTNDEQHWPGPNSGPLDDGVYNLEIVSQNRRCALRLSGPFDPQTGLQYSREISIGSDSPEISFRAEMKNASAHPIQWSVQSVTQYDLSDGQNPATYNRQFWAFAPLSPHSSYLDGYHVRSGMADDPSFSIKGGLFALHWLYLQNEVWLDSSAGWIAMLDGATQYGMIERFRYQSGAEYPGKATVIFYQNGPAIEVDNSGVVSLTSAHPQQNPYYMEAELNSPLQQLPPGGTYSFDTEWFPTRLQSEVVTVRHAGAVAKPLVAIPGPGNIELSGAFGVFYAGKLVACSYNARGLQTSLTGLRRVDPLEFVILHEKIASAPGTVRVSVHLLDEQGKDEGSLGEAQVAAENKDL